MKAQANAWLGVVIVFGVLFGTAQVARGEHYPSHVIGSAWICQTKARASPGTVARTRATCHQHRHPSARLPFAARWIWWRGQYGLCVA